MKTHSFLVTRNNLNKIINHNFELIRKLTVTKSLSSDKISDISISKNNQRLNNNSNYFIKGSIRLLSSSKTKNKNETSNITKLTKIKRSNNSSSILIDPQQANYENIVETNVSLQFSDAMREFKKMNTPKKLLLFMQNYPKETGNKYFNLHELLLSIRTLQRMNRSDLCIEIFPHIEKLYSSIVINNTIDHIKDIGVSIAILKIFSKLENMDIVEKIAKYVGVQLDSYNENQFYEDIIRLNPNSYSIILSEMSYGFISVNLYYKSMKCLNVIKENDLLIDPEISRKIFKKFIQSTKHETIREALKLLLEIGGLDDNESVQLLTSAYMRQIDFVKGAVSMKTLPQDENNNNKNNPEVAFIGRSNVGKSSLINMISNRKGLAFTSKTPGKTSEFNYFASQGIVGINKEKINFYLVDLPGVGYAQKSRDLRASWTNLLTQYVNERSTLRVLFHLIDSRHGLLDADEECLALLENIPSHVEYVIVLTKVDKNRSSSINSDIVNINGINSVTNGLETVVRSGIIDRIYKEIAKRTTRVVPILFTSSESKQGGGHVWSAILEGISK